MTTTPAASRRGIGALSRQTGCNVETIRYYERIGLLPPARRSDGGHRVYADAHVRRLGFIRRTRQLGFTLDEVRTLLRLVDGGRYTCAQVKRITLHHLDDIRQKIADLRTIERVLAEMAAQCDGGRVPHCPVIDALFAETAERTVGPVAGEPLETGAAARAARPRARPRRASSRRP